MGFNGSASLPSLLLVWHHGACSMGNSAHGRPGDFQQLLVVPGDFQASKQAIRRPSAPPSHQRDCPGHVSEVEIVRSESRASCCGNGRVVFTQEVWFRIFTKSEPTQASPLAALSPAGAGH